ncbi:MAG TPA: wax ester/triacylglycerol synthase family O-acyltransferase [Polyangiaceae bacterium]
MATRRPLSALDRTFLAGETRESMMHVGVLAPFSPPADPPRDFLRSLVEELKRKPKAHPPWTLKLRHPEILASPLQAWVEDDDLDVEYHVRRSALPSPGDERELGILVSRLHSNKIDFHRPPWEVHLIEGLEGGRFAMYFKVHHALVDGFTGMRLLTRSLSSDPSDVETPLFFARQPPEPTKRAETPDEPTFDHLLHLLRDQVGASRDVGRAAMNLLRSARSKEHPLVTPLQAPRCVLNGKITRNRRFATQRFDVERLRRLSHAQGGTLNDAVLALTAAALRRFLLEQDALPDDPLTTMVPVNIRPKGDTGGGNEVGAILASLATDLADPRDRLRAIVASTKRAKEQLQGMSKSALLQYSALILAPMLLSQIPGAAGRVRPAFNVVISNVPGPTKPLYFRGWRLEAIYPLSIPFHGYGLNITVSGYDGELDFGFTGCRDTVPHLQRLAVYAGEAADELEAAMRP